VRMPNADNAVIPDAKIGGYLLSATHRDGKHKARFFELFGFTAEDPAALADALRQHIADHEVALVEPTPYGVRYVVERIMTTPDGRTPWVRSVWFIDKGQEIPGLATAYPLRRPADD